MKAKTVATGCNRKQLKSKCLELAALVEWKGVQLLAVSVENKKLIKEINELKSKLGLQDKLLKDTKEKLITQKNITCSTSKAAEDMERDYYEQSKKLEEANKAISQRDNTINNQNNTISALQIKVIELSHEIDRRKQPRWKKWWK